MKKDKKWLKNEIEDMCPLTVNGEEYLDSDRVFELIDQLDDQSRQIDKLANFIMSEVEGEPSQSQSAVDTAIRIIKSYEPQKVVVPKWFDEWYRDYNGSFTYTNSKMEKLRILYVALETHKFSSEQEKYLIDNQDDFIRAILDGYEVEEEKLYWVKLPINEHFTYMMKNKAEDIQYFGEIGFCSEEFKDRQSTHFTEEEIKDYDERYWAFAVEVEE